MARVRTKKEEHEEPAVQAEQEEATTREEEIDKESRIIQQYKDRIKNPLTAIRAHCVECMGGSPQAVAGCTAPNCSLYPLRMGRNTMHASYDKPRPKKAEEKKE